MLDRRRAATDTIGPVRDTSPDDAAGAGRGRMPALRYTTTCLAQRRLDECACIHGRWAACSAPGSRGRARGRPSIASVRWPPALKRAPHRPANPSTSNVLGDRVPYGWVIDQAWTCFGEWSMMDRRVGYRPALGSGAAGEGSGEEGAGGGGDAGGVEAEVGEDGVGLAVGRGTRRGRPAR